MWGLGQGLNSRVAFVVVGEKRISIGHIADGVVERVANLTLQQLHYFLKMILADECLLI